MIIIPLLVSLFICALFHEAAHFVAARLCGCAVEVFSIGFWKPYFQIRIGRTDFRITPWLLGGYCQLKEELQFESEYGYLSLPYSQKVFISAIGCIINIIMGIIATKLGEHYFNFNLMYFGFISFWLGVTNLIPIIPCLDGGYITYYPILVKKYGNEQGTKIFGEWVKKTLKWMLELNKWSLVLILFWCIYQQITTGTCFLFLKY